MPKLDYNFFCNHCKTALCDDCKNTALEYVELFTNYRLKLINNEFLVEEAKRESERLQKESDSYKEILTIGMTEVYKAWFLSMDADQLLERIKHHNEHLKKMQELETMLNGKKPIDPRRLTRLFK